MGININGNSVKKVTFNGTDIKKVIYNGTVVFVKGVELQFTVITDSSGNGSFTIPGLPINNEIEVSTVEDVSATWDIVEVNNVFTVNIHSSLTDRVINIVVIVYPLLEWNTISMPFDNDLEGVVYGDDRYVAVSKNGAIAYSTNGISWKESVDKKSNDLYSVAFGEVIKSETKEVTTDSRGYALIDLIEAGIYGDKVTSISVTEDSSATTNIFFNEEDGIEYLEINSSLASQSISVVISFKLNIFVAVGAGGTALYSESYGYDWKYGWSGTNGTPTSFPIFDIVYGDGKFFAVGVGGTILYSNDGRKWTEIKDSTIIGSTSFRAAAYGNGVMVAIGGSYAIYYDTINEIKKRSYVTDGDLSDIAYGDGKFVTVEKYDGNAIIRYSTNGTSFDIGFEISEEELTCVTYGNGVFVAVGASGNTYYSTDAVNWHKNPTEWRTAFNDITYGDEAFVAVGDGGKGIVAHY